MDGWAAAALWLLPVKESAKMPLSCDAEHAATITIAAAKMAAFDKRCNPLLFIAVLSGSKFADTPVVRQSDYTVITKG
jgi:hypothetical protein